MPQAGIYCRISSDRDDTRLGVERQEADCRRLCAERGWTVAEVYVDNDISAASPRKRRPKYERLLTDIQLGRIDAVVVWSEDRLHRRPMELEQFVNVCEAAGVTQFASIGGDISLNDPSALMVLRIKAVVAKHEVDRTRERILRKQQELAERGLPSGGGRRAFGWNRDGTTVMEREADLVREAANRVLEGGSLHGIAADWNERGIPTVCGGPWRPNSVKAMLRNPRNAGLRQYRGEILGTAVWSPILDRETWDQLQVIFHGNKQQRALRSSNRPYPLRSILKCGTCGKSLIALPRKKPTQVQPDRHVRFYGCRKDAGGCGSVSVKADLVEEAVYETLLGLVDSPALRELTHREADAEASEIRSLVLQIATEQARLAELEDAFVAGDLSRDGLRRGSRTINDQIEQLKARLSTLRGASALDRFEGRSIREHWLELNQDEQRAIILSLVHRITVHKANKRGANGFDRQRLRFSWRYDALYRIAEEAWSAAPHAERRSVEREVHEAGERERRADLEGLEEAYAEWTAQVDATERQRFLESVDGPQSYEEFLRAWESWYTTDPLTVPAS